VAQLAEAARQTLDEMVLASSQGALRAGAQVGVHVEQTLGSDLTTEHLDAYRTRSSRWVGASRWDELLVLASSAADDEAPAFDHGIVNGEAASRAALPQLQFTTEDPTAARAAVYAALRTPEDTLLNLGLVGAGLVGTGMNAFDWDGTVVTFADGQPAMLDVWLDAPQGQQSILSIEGAIYGVSPEPILAFLVFGSAEPVASTIVIAQEGLTTTLGTGEIALAAPGATFMPVYYEYGGAEPQLVVGTPLPITAQGFELYSSYLLPGEYHLLTALTDIWGNEAVAIDPVTLTESLEP
jgi:hypothetical protein